MVIIKENKLENTKLNNVQKKEIKKAILFAMTKKLFNDENIDLTTFHKMNDKINKL